MLQTAQLLPQKGFRRWASTRPVSRPSRQPATGPPGSYPDGTHTRWRRRACVGSGQPINHPQRWAHEEEHIQASEPERLDGEEVARHDRRGVGAKELVPAELGASAGRRHTGLPEDLRDCCRRDSLTDACELTDDPLVAPPRVLPGKTKHQRTNLLGDRGPTRSPSSVRPPFPHKLAMPAKQRIRANEERWPARPAQQLAGCRQEHPISLVQPRTNDLAAKNGEFVAQHHDLELLVLPRAQPQRRNRQHASKQQVQQRYDQAAPSLDPNPKKTTLRS